jgi:hypothetical protein
LFSSNSALCLTVETLPQRTWDLVTKSQGRSLAPHQRLALWRDLDAFLLPYREEVDLATKRSQPEAIQALGIRPLIQEIEADKTPTGPRPLPPNR